MKSTALLSTLLLSVFSSAHASPGEKTTTALPLLAFASGESVPAPRDAAPPNIVVIFIDDMGYADIGPFFGKEKDKGYATPNLDRMAAEGTKFTDFYVSQAICSASRASILTGCYANRVGIVAALAPRSKVGLSPDETTLAEVCKARGYATACFGKWHLGDAREFLPLQQGFDEYFGLPYSNDMKPIGPSGERRGYPSLPLFSQNAVVNPSVDDATQDRLTTLYTEHATDFIRRNKDRPFFLYLPHTMVHVPLHVSEKFRGKTKRGLFGDAVEELDWSVGQVLDALKTHGLDEKTLVVFTSDNGPWLSYGEHAGSAAPLREGKSTDWEGGVRVPTLMRRPGVVPAGRTCAAPLMTIDLLPTVARLVGTGLPPRKIDGLDITDVITGKTDASPHEALAFYYDKNDLHGIRSNRWKLELPRAYNTLAGKPGGSGGKPAPYAKGKVTQPELYDLAADPGETHDVAAENPEVMARLLEQAERFRADLGDDATGRKGTGLREPGRTGAGSVFPASTRASDAK